MLRFRFPRVLYAPDEGAGSNGGDSGKQSKEGAGEEEDGGEGGRSAGAVAVLVGGKTEYLTPEEIAGRLEAAEKDKTGHAAALAEKDDAVTKATRDSSKALKLHTTIKQMRSAKTPEEQLKAARVLVEEYPEAGLTKEHLKQIEGEIGGGKGSAAGEDQEAGPIREDDLDEDLREEMKDGRDDRNYRKAQQVSYKMKELLDNDELVRDIINDETVPEGLVGQIREVALGELQRRARASSKGVKWRPTPEDFRAGVQKARSLLVNTGYLEAGDVDDTNENGNAGRRASKRTPGAGRAPVAAVTHHRGREQPKFDPTEKGASGDKNFTDYFNALADENDLAERSSERSRRR